MFKKLQVKFVALVMGVATLILCAVFVSIGAMTCQQAAQQLAADLETSIDVSANAFERPEARAPLPQAPDADAAGEGQGQLAPPQLGQRPEERLASPVAVYVLEDGALTLASRSSAALDDAVRTEAVEACSDAPEDEVVPGPHGLVLLKRQVRGTTYVAFADDSARVALRGLLPTFAVVGAGALAVFFAISILFARWALRPVRQAWDQQRAFVSNASHELKTPLAIIKANTEILLDEPDADAAARAKWLASTQESAEGMEALVNDMLALASLDELAEQGSVRIAAHVAGPFDLSRQLEGLALQFESRAFEGGFALEADIVEGVQARADADAVARLMQILLDNACKYVGAGGTVTVRLECADGAARVSVANTGPLIPPEQQERIFQRFYRADEAHAGAGHGLGLSIAKALSDQLGAGLSVTSTDAVTTFAFRLSRA